MGAVVLIVFGKSPTIFAKKCVFERFIKQLCRDQNDINISLSAFKLGWYGFVILS
jgi:hypothetical protein